MAGSRESVNGPKPEDRGSGTDRPVAAGVVGGGLDKDVTVKASARSKRSSLVVAFAGLEIGVVIVGATLLGRWLDSRFDSEPWLMLVGLAVGLIGGTYNLWKIGRSFFDG